MSSDKSFRFAVGSAGGPRSSTWIVFCSKKTADWYAAVRTLAGVQKYSFHESGKWGWGFVEQAADLYVDEGASRHLDLWDRPAEFVPGWTRALSIRIPTNGLRMLPDEATAKVTFVEPTAEWTTIELLEGTAGARTDALPPCRLHAQLPLVGGAMVVVTSHSDSPPTQTITGPRPELAREVFTPTARVGLMGYDDAGVRVVVELPADVLLSSD
ncbi:hypothetical protein SEA_BEEGEE_32 [Gordonia phage BeeGee]|nr:hypothetical protein SEA_BEEGEE_32 [Gordonia phage BeeGee]